MPLILKIKKHLLKLLLVTAVFSIFAATVPVANAGFWADAGKAAGEMFKTGDQGLSFTQYEGQLAQLTPDGYDTAITSSSDLKGFVIRIVNFALGFLGLIAVIIIIYAGVLYVISGGNDDQTGTAKKAIGYAVVGLLIVMGSYAFVNTVIKGAGGGVDGNSSMGSTGKSSGAFNASAEEVRSLAVEIFNGFKFLSETSEDLQNIKNDAEKESLNPKSLPPKTSIVNFLISVQSKLTTIKSKLQAFTVAEARINELIRSIATDLDSIQILTDTDLVKLGNDGKMSYCSREDIGDDEKTFADEFRAAYNGEKFRDWYCKEKKHYKDTYQVGLYEKWNMVQQAYTSIHANEAGTPLRQEVLPNIYGIIQPIAADYSKQLEEIFKRLEQIYSSFSNIQAIKDGNANKAYEIMKGATAYGYTAELADRDNPNIYTVSAVTGGLLQNIKAWTVDSQSSIDIIGGLLIEGLKQHSILYDELANLQFVQARLSANVVEGAAPLTVVFDTVGSSDPAGGSINGQSNIVWDIGGARTISGLFNYDPANEGGNKVINSPGVSCDLTGIPAEEQASYVSNTAKRCRFDQPGTYTAAVKINSNDATKFAPGISVVTIKVRPPTNKINLTMKAGSRDPIDIMAYNGDFLESNLRTVSITLEDAKSGNGIHLDASGTKLIEKYKWTISNGYTTESSNGILDYDGIKKPGKYDVTLTVTNQLGVSDSKVFTIEVGSLAAILKANPTNEAFVGQNVILDASESHSDLGKIVSYEWLITAKNIQKAPPEVQAKIAKDYPFKASGANLRTLTHQFKYQLDYDIQVIVSDGSSEDKTAIISDYKVSSKPPVALFNYSTPKPNQPATVAFDGSSSFDPDNNNDNSFSYLWTIKPEGKWKLDEGDVANGLTTSTPTVKFLEKGDYDVTLKVVDNLKQEEFTELTKKIKIDNILDVAWAPTQEVTSIMATEGEGKGKAHMDFNVLSDNAIAYEVDFGDGNNSNGDLHNTAIIPHDYLQAGKYNVKVTVYDAEDNSTTITRNIFIGGGDKPVAKITLKMNDAVISDFSQPVKVNKKDILAFDAEASKNTDGTGRDLVYSWDFGDTGKSSSRLENHKFKELSPLDPGYYTVRLTVTDKDDAKKTDTDEIQIDVVNSPPRFSSIQAIPVAISGALVTPVTVQVRAYGAEDIDGEITEYKWWYFDVDDPSEPLGIQITKTPNAQLIIGTRGKNGEKMKYGFGLEVVDSDNLSYSPDYQSMSESEISKVEVVNGPNELPVAKFSVNTTNAYAGDKVIFSSSSTDSDGQIKSYIWDTEGDGFYNNEPTTKATYEYIYSQKNTDGYNARLKVVDDKGGESISQPVRIYIDSLAKPPNAAFTFKVVDGSEGKKVKFTNHSEADPEAGAKIISYKWDFDTNSTAATSDSDGDGIKDNDVDSQAKDPERLFTGQGTFTVKLTITDDQGNTDQVVNTLTVPLSLPPTAAFTFKVVDGKVIFKNNSTSDSEHGAKVEKYIWDFDNASTLATADSDGDGIKDNDNNSTEFEPVYQYLLGGIYKVKLTVADNYGNKDFVVNSVDTNLVNPGDSTVTTDSSTIKDETKDVLETLRAMLTTDPMPDSDGIVYLPGTVGTVKFDFSKSIGTIAYYIIDKNIYFDTNGNGIPNDDEDFKTVFPGTWTTNYDQSWGKTTAKLTVKDIYGNEHSVNQEIKYK